MVDFSKIIQSEIERTEEALPNPMKNGENPFFIIAF